MKLPRDLGGDELCRLLGKYGYGIVRQTGSHIRMTAKVKGDEYHITIPQHSPIKTGTLNGILNDVAAHLGIDKIKLKRELFG